MKEHTPHPIIERPHEHRIVDFHYHVGADEEESYIDLVLRRDETIRRLRFWAPQNLEIETGFPEPTRGMVILDVRADGLDGLGVRVADFEASRGSVTFWARKVVDLDAVVAFRDDSITEGRGP